MDPDRAPAGSVVVVEVRELHDSIRQVLDSRPGKPFRVIELVRHRGADLVGGVRLELVEELPLSRAKGGDLGPHVAEDLLRHAHVGFDEAQQRGVGLTPVDDLGGRDPEPLLEDLGAVGRVAARDPPAHVGVVQDDGEERNPLVVLEHRPEHEDVVEMARPRIRVVVGEDIARLHVVAEVVEASPEGGHGRAEMHRQGEALGHEPAGAVADGGREVEVVLDHRRARGPDHGEDHVVRDGDEPLVDELAGEGFVCNFLLPCPG